MNDLSRIASIALLAAAAIALTSSAPAQEPSRQEPAPVSESPDPERPDPERQDPEHQDPERQDPERQQPDKLTEWPKLKRTQDRRARALVKQYRKDGEELHAEATRSLTELGAGVAPVLFPLVTDRADNVNEHLFGVLDAVVDRRHAALLAREVGRRSVEWRRYAMRRLCRFLDPELLPVLAKASKDEDQEVAFLASLGMLAQHRGDGLDNVMLAARQRWLEVVDLVAEVLPAARSAATANLVFEKIASARPTDQMAGLRLLRYLAVKDQGVILRTYLASSDFTVKREAINTARVMHGEKPLEKLASFQAIEMAKEWLQKL